MKYPSLVVDNFYKKPNEVREFALSLAYTKAEHGEYPGKRSKALYEVDDIFYHLFCNKFMSLFYDFLYTQGEWTISTQFQLIEPFDADKNSELNQGWIHQDADSILAGIIYLTPDADLNSGTSIYSIKPNMKPNLIIDERRNFHKNGIADTNYIDELQRHTNCFVETTKVSNVYNRLIAYDTNEWHRASNHHAGSLPRLTQVINVVNINTILSAPITRCDQSIL